jgi:hypothetical protein
MTIANIGQVNVSGLSVPQALVQIVPPQFLFNGVSTNICGIIGTASWGPVNLATEFGGYSQFAGIFGPTINRNFDMGGHVILARAQGAGFFSGVRVTDGTDVAASATVQAGASQATNSVTFVSNPAAATTMTINGSVWTFVNTLTTGLQIRLGANLAATLSVAVATLNPSTDTNTSKISFASTATVLSMTSDLFGTAGNSYTLATNVSGATVGSATFSGGAAGTTGMTLTGKYTGSLGNFVKANVLSGTAANSFKVVVYCPGLATEIFDNLAIGLTGLPAWTAIVAGINGGTSGVRPASNIVIATVGTSTAAPSAGITSLSGGADGAGSVTTAQMVGVDALPRTGMYALRGTGVAQFTLADCSDLTALSTLVAFGIDIGAYGVMSTVMSDTITNASAELSAYGIDSFVVKVIFGDWVVWLDTVNGIPQRVTAPSAVTLGLLGNLSPQENTLNKPINGIIGTQSMVLNRTYSQSDYQTLAAARMDVITVDKSLSNNIIHRLGINTSSNLITFGDEYTRVIFFLAKSINLIGSHYIGANMTPDEMLDAKVALQQFLALAVINGIIYTFDRSQAYQVVLDTSNNTQATAALGYQYAYVKVVIGPIVRYFIINLEGGSSVVISSTPPSAAGITPV